MWLKILAFLRRDFQTQASYRLAFVIRLVGMFVSIGTFYFISQILGSAVSPYLNRYGGDYFHFALLGIAFYPFIGISANSLANVVNEYQQTGTLEILFVSPTPIVPALLMSTVWNYCWAFLEMLFFLVAGALIFQAQFNWPNIFFAIIVLLFTIMANAGLGFINAAFVLVTKRVSPLTRLIALFTNLLAGVYYPVEVLPSWLRTFSFLFPATYSLDALRHTMLLQGSPLDVWSDLLALSLFTIVLLPAGLVAFHYGVRWAKMDGSLSQY
jgi:ABC-2 type transport system permease protein